MVGGSNGFLPQGASTNHFAPISRLLNRHPTSPSPWGAPPRGGAGGGSGGSDLLDYSSHGPQAFEGGGGGGVNQAGNFSNRYNQQQVGNGNGGPNGTNSLLDNISPVVSSYDGFVYKVQFKRSFRNFLRSADVMKPIHINDHVIVEADRGEDLGIVSEIQPMPLFFREGGSLFSRDNKASTWGDKRTGVKHILRHALPQEFSLLPVKMAEEQSIVEVCREHCAGYLLPMFVVDAEYQFDRHKLIIYYASNSRRIDFRELVRDLFAIYKTRIWMEAVSSYSYRPTPGEGSSGRSLLNGVHPSGSLLPAPGGADASGVGASYGKWIAPGGDLAGPDGHLSSAPYGSDASLHDFRVAVGAMGGASLYEAGAYEGGGAAVGGEGSGIPTGEVSNAIGGGLTASAIKRAGGRDGVQSPPPGVGVVGGGASLGYEYPALYPSGALAAEADYYTQQYQGLLLPTLEQQQLQQQPQVTPRAGPLLSQKSPAQSLRGSTTSSSASASLTSTPLPGGHLGFFSSSSSASAALEDKIW